MLVSRKYKKTNSPYWDSSNALVMVVFYHINHQGEWHDNMETFIISPAEQLIEHQHL